MVTRVGLLMFQCYLHHVGVLRSWDQGLILDFLLLFVTSGSSRLWPWGPGLDSWFSIVIYSVWALSALVARVSKQMSYNYLQHLSVLRPCGLVWIIHSPLLFAASGRYPPLVTGSNHWIPIFIYSIGEFWSSPTLASMFGWVIFCCYL